jgi:hypothetical protein
MEDFNSSEALATEGRVALLLLFLVHELPKYTMPADQRWRQLPGMHPAQHSTALPRTQCRAVPCHARTQATHSLGATLHASSPSSAAVGTLLHGLCEDLLPGPELGEGVRAEPPGLPDISLFPGLQRQAERRDLFRANTQQVPI